MKNEYRMKKFKDNKEKKLLSNKLKKFCLKSRIVNENTVLYFHLRNKLAMIKLKNIVILKDFIFKKRSLALLF